MRRIPSMKSVLLCGFAAVVLVLSIPTNPHVKSTNQPSYGAIPTLGQAAVTDESTDHSPAAATTNGTNGYTKPVPKPKPGPQRPNSAGTPGAVKPSQPAPAPNQVQPGAPTPKSTSPSNSTQSGTPSTQPAGPESWGYTGRAKLSKLRVRVIDGRTQRPLSGAEVVVIETEKRYKTDATGHTEWFEAPVIRNPKYRPMIAELHGQLGVIVYKNGYRDSIHLGIRMHEGISQQATVWMYKIGPQDRRIEPVLYQEPYHHIWLIELADKFRQKSQIGEGPERP
ncbi:hypothetical protein [Alicyclobacillus dauci]|uniref:Uncharacterized protein n=1 Tax=Alicyclobacillus dauci TaxID=1475485 RepID=A0ABY6YZ57_9BACL|nr:hypothetical protein [Alicyclobacillus dauci]WAH35737.1 hypothetical protein NZD86_15855 [Alicyclobacillus dauci]